MLRHEYTPPTEEQVRKRLEKKRRVQEWAWRLCVDDEYVSACTEADCEADFEESFESLIERMDRLLEYAPTEQAPEERLDTGRRAASQAHKSKESRVPAVVWRSRAVSALVAADARRRDEVTEFRRDVLGNSLLAADEVAGWIEREHKREGQLTVDFSLTVRITADTQAELVKLFAEKRMKGRRLTLQDFGGLPVEAVGFHGSTITYGKPGEECSYSLPVKPDGLLGRLQKIAEKLSKDYHWSAAQAVHFVLTDGMPYSGIAGTLQYGRVTRLVLSIPTWYSTADVARAYENRRESFGDLGKHRLAKRPQSISERIARLVIFRCKHPDVSWRELCCLWRRESDIPKEWHYADERAISTAFNRAANTLMESV